MNQNQIKQFFIRGVMLLLLTGIVIPLSADVGLYKRIDLSANSVADHRMVIGDLNGDGEIDFLFNDGRRSIKAFDHNGVLLWEIFNPNDPGVAQDFHNFTISIYDIDLDQQNEVICYLEVNSQNHLAVLTGATGQIETSVELPFAAPRDHEYWGSDNYYMQDHIAIANLRGLATPQDILAIHTSLEKVAAYAFENGTLQLKWYWVTDQPSYATGHYAFPYDIDGDGRDEVIAGVDVLDENGTRLWYMNLLPFNLDHPDWGRDHVDAAVCADIDPDYPGNEIIVVAGNGIWLYDDMGNILWNKLSKLQDPVNGLFGSPTEEGAQEVLVGNFRPDTPGLEMVIYDETMEGANTVGLFDKDGNVLVWGDQDYGPRRWVTAAVDWDGDRAIDEIYSRTGIHDSNFNRISYSMKWNFLHTYDKDEFPPIVADIQGDQREEIIWYDQDEIIILYNTDPLNVPVKPSPWTNIDYRLRYANNNHCSAYYFDWREFDKDSSVPPPSPPDDQDPPNAPTNLTSPEQTENSIFLNWMAPPAAADGDTACAYQIFRDGTLITTITFCQFTDNGLMDDTPYSYAIYACDDADNRSLAGATGTYVTVPIYFPHNPDPETSSITANVEMYNPTIQNNQHFLPITLSTSEIVVQIPNPLVLQESDGSVTQILMQGNIPGTQFNGLLLITENLAGGEGIFHLHEGALVSTNGEIGNEIVEGRQINIDKEPPPCPNSLQILH